jgi:EAL domain-containing protein (putative c-di-GMP-specific phosphodiesterase class I)
MHVDQKIEDNGALVLLSVYQKVIEETMLCGSFFKLLFELLCQQVSQYNEGCSFFSIFISYRLIRSVNFAPYVRGVLQRYDVDPGLIVFNIPGIAFNDGRENTLSALASIKDIGVKFACIDGSFSPKQFETLNTLGVTRLLITKEYTQDVNNTAALNALLLTARSFKMETVAEGVDSAMLFDVLSDLGCDYFEITKDFFAKDET